MKMMKKTTFGKALWYPLLSGLVVGALALLLTTGLAMASSVTQEDDPSPHADNSRDCSECHLDIAENWSHSPHAHAYDDPVFQDLWVGKGKPGECLSCHTTNYQASTGDYTAEGIACESCHGKTSENHPPEIIPVKANTEYCGSCHITTLSEWRTTGHAAANIGCMDCHDPHSQDALFEDADKMCLNCHKEEDMGDYLNTLHGQNDIGCVDCHALVIPPDVVPDDGIVPTGHAFNITPATCVACHTDALHTGFSLPGYENGAAAATETNEKNGEEIVGEEDATEVTIEEEMQPEQRLQALEAALASRNMTMLFQGGVIGLVFGGSTAWIVARNIRRLPEEEETDDDEEA